VSTSCQLSVCSANPAQVAELLKIPVALVRRCEFATFWVERPQSEKIVVRLSDSEPTTTTDSR
jgi:hypothetical protein